MARAEPRGKVWRKPDAKLRADEQEHHMRRRLEASWHKTTKPCDLTATVNDAVVQGKLMRLFGEICLTGDRKKNTRQDNWSNKSPGMAVSSTGMSESDETDSALWSNS